MNFLIAYDIEDDKVRKKVSTLLDEFGSRVNYSVYECELNATKLRKLKHSLLEVMNKQTDSIRFYHICQNCLPKSFELSPKKRDIFEQDELYV